MSGARVVILMGSGSDQPHASTILRWLDEFGVRHETRVASAHKTPAKLLALLDEYERSGDRIIYIAIAGLSNALSGMVDFQTVNPVVSCPPPSGEFGGADIFSSLRMPPGVAPALVLDPKNAALFCAKILARDDASIAGKIRDFQRAQREKIDREEAALADAPGSAGSAR